MINRKKDIAQEIAYMFLFGDISNTTELSYAARDFYKRHGILFATKRVRSEYPFIYLVSKHDYGISLSDFEPFINISVRDHVYEKMRKREKISKDLLHRVGKSNIKIATHLMGINLHHSNLDLVSDEESVEFYEHLVKSFRVLKPLTDQIKKYISHKVFEGILDGNISSRGEKERLKRSISDLYDIDMPSDEEMCLQILPQNSHINFDRKVLERTLNVDLDSVIQETKRSKWGYFLSKCKRNCYKVLGVIDGTCQGTSIPLSSIIEKVRKDDLPPRAIPALYTFGFIEAEFRNDGEVDIETVEKCCRKKSRLEDSSSILAYLSKDGQKVLDDYEAFKKLMQWRIKTGSKFQIS